MVCFIVVLEAKYLLQKLPYSKLETLFLPGNLNFQQELGEYLAVVCCKAKVRDRMRFPYAQFQLNLY
jgi:hypothetical protein